MLRIISLSFRQEAKIEKVNLCYIWNCVDDVTDGRSSGDDQARHGQAGQHDVFPQLDFHDFD
jgi:hypothetical protein